MRATPVNQGLLSELQGHLSADLFASATPVRRTADEVLFVAGDAGNGCYRVEDGLIKVTMMSRAGVERILAFLGPGAIVGELQIAACSLISDDPFPNHKFALVPMFPGKRCRVLEGSTHV